MTQFKSQSQFILPPLPYPENALESVISAKTLSFHYGKHHKNYVDKLNQLAANTEYTDMSLEDVIGKTADDTTKIPIFNNAAQVWNHDFYWNSFKSKGGGTPKGKIADAIKSSFKSFDDFKSTLIDTAVDQFGSGYAWVVYEGNSLKIIKTPNAANPMTKKQTPLLAIDVWEHAYYLDYQNRRKDYVQAVIESLLNWDFANQNLAAIRK